MRSFFRATFAITCANAVIMMIPTVQSAMRVVDSNASRNQNSESQLNEQNSEAQANERDQDGVVNRADVEAISSNSVPINILPQVSSQTTSSEASRILAERAADRRYARHLETMCANQVKSK